MALIPLLFDDLIRPLSLFDKKFGLSLENNELYQPHCPFYYRPWRAVTRKQSGVSNISNDKDKFQVNLDVQQFKPKEITVKTVENSIVVEGKHEEKQDEHGYISRHFVRRYVLPKDVDVDKVQCNLSSDGVLNVSMPKKALEAPKSDERVIPITPTNAPAVKAAEAAPTATANTS